MRVLFGADFFFMVDGYTAFKGRLGVAAGSDQGEVAVLIRGPGFYWAKGAGPRVAHV